MGVCLFVYALYAWECVFVYVPLNEWGVCFMYMVVIDGHFLLQRMILWRPSLHLVLKAPSFHMLLFLAWVQFYSVITLGMYSFKKRGVLSPCRNKCSS